MRHPDRPTGLRCVRCERPACPECLREAAVGYQCVDCVNEGRRTVRRGTTVAGAELGSKVLVVPILIAINVLVFIWTAIDANSIRLNSQSTVFDEGALWAPLVQLNGEWWRLVTNGFLHIGLTHLLLNMVSLYLVGRDLELLFGRARFLALYMLSLLGGSTAVYMLSTSPTAGASGAVYGVLGALLVAVLRLKMSPTMVLVLIGLNLALSFSGVMNISWEAHIGGLVVGILVAAGFLYAPARVRNQVQTATALGVLVLLVILLVGVGPTTQFVFV